jgi:signal transduction histidine kinase
MIIDETCKERFKNLLTHNETWLMKSILEYAKKLDYTRYTSTLEGAWRLSIVGLTRSFIENLEESKDTSITIGPDKNKGAITNFAQTEAILHRKRGVTLKMFLGLMKYYRESYLDLCKEKSNEEDREEFMSYIRWCFDLIEVDFCDEWSKVVDQKLFDELQMTNRYLVNEKNAYLTVFESFNDPIIMLDFDRRVTNINHAAAGLFDVNASTPGKNYYDLVVEGKKRETGLMNRSVFELLPWLKPEDLGTGRIREKKTFEREVEVNDEVRFYQIVISDMLDVSEKFTATILNIKDLTDRKRIEERLEEAVKTKDKFFSIIAHDLFSPFTTILGLTEILCEDTDSFSEEEVKKMIGRLHNSSLTLVTMIKNLLSWSRAQTNSLDYVPKKFNIKDIIEHNIELLKENADKKEIHLSHNVLEDQSVFADKEMINTTIRNLITNAIKFTSKGGFVKVEMKNLEKDVEVSIIDNGVGIKEENMGKLFKEGEKVHTLGTEKESGTGLGLLLCFEFIKRNHGQLTVESKEGEGSQFKLTLPKPT